jgi:hypothetical protein
MELVGDHVEAAHELGAVHGEAAGETAGGTAARDLAHLDAVVVDVHLGQPLQPPFEQLDLGRAGTLLRREDLGGLDEARAHVAGDDEVGAP